MSVRATTGLGRALGVGGSLGGEMTGIVEPVVGADGPRPGQGVPDQQSGEMEEIAVLELGHRGA